MVVAGRCACAVAIDANRVRDVVEIAVAVLGDVAFAAHSDFARARNERARTKQKSRENPANHKPVSNSANVLSASYTLMLLTAHVHRTLGFALGIKAIER